MFPSGFRDEVIRNFVVVDTADMEKFESPVILMDLTGALHFRRFHLSYEDACRELQDDSADAALLEAIHKPDLMLAGCLFPDVNLAPWVDTEVANDPQVKELMTHSHNWFQGIKGNN